MNTNDGAIELLQQKPNKINWECLSMNTNDGVIDLLQENQDKIDWEKLSANPNIFVQCNYVLK
jgi:hypothetical protein